MPWYHQIALLEKLDTADERLGYAHAAVEHGWSRNVLVLRIEARTLECEIEKALVDHVTAFLVELGVDFAYVGRQVPLEIGGEDYFIDLLFYQASLPSVERLQQELSGPT